MPLFQARRRVYHSANEMFDLVADVERYPKFVPLCERHVVRSRTKWGEIEFLMTDMTVSYKIFRETFRSRVTLDRANGCIVVTSIDGPLDKLETRWTFQARDDGSCDVKFYLSYELASRTLALLMGGVFDAAFSRFVEAFEHRADALYGRRSLAGTETRQTRAFRYTHCQPLRRRQYGACKTAPAHSVLHDGDPAAT